MKQNNFTIRFAVPQTPEAVFAAASNVRGWWSEAIEGKTDRLGAVFTFRYQDVHRSTHQITEWEPGRKIVWRTTGSRLGFVRDKTEWNGTEIVFEIARKGRRTELQFTHVGLVPAVECYDGCSGAWHFHVKDSLRRLITTGKGEPNQKE